MTTFNLDKQFFISEHFQSFQGEGRFAGQNALFVRMQFCNLRCVWCDTKYTWKEDLKRVQEYSEEELIRMIESSISSLVVVTGGEPLLYNHSKLKTLSPTKTIQFESNGSIRPDKALKMTLPGGSTVRRSAMDSDFIQNCHFAISPKLSSAKSGYDYPVDYEYWNQLPGAFYKFVIADEKEDFTQIEDLESRYAIPKNKIFLSIEGVSAEKQLNAKLLEAIIERGYHFSPRLHVLYFGAKRGV